MTFGDVSFTQGQLYQIFFVVVQLSSRQQDENEAHSFNKCSLNIKQHVIEWVVLMGYNHKIYFFLCFSKLCQCG